MKDVTGLQVTQVRIFPEDSIPFFQFISGEGNVKGLQDRFEFKAIEPAQEQTELNFRFGSFEGNAVFQVSISQRQFVTVTFGESKLAGMVHASVMEYIASVVPDFDKDLEPVVMTEETQCVVEMEFAMTDLLNPKLAAFLNSNTLPSIASDGTAAHLKAGAAVFLVGFTDETSALDAHGISLSDKNLRIESRTNTPLDQRKFFTSSPTDSATHLRLLRELERSLRPN